MFQEIYLFLHYSKQLRKQFDLIKNATFIFIIKCIKISIRYQNRKNLHIYILKKNSSRP